MAIRVPVLLRQAPYEVIVGTDLLARTGEFILQVLPAGKCALITDSNIAPLYGDKVKASLEEAGFTVIPVIVPAGETYLVAYTCDLDEPAVDADAPVTPPATGETVVFTPPEGQLAPVTANQAVEVNF